MTDQARGNLARLLCKRECPAMNCDCSPGSRMFELADQIIAALVSLGWQPRPPSRPATEREAEARIVVRQYGPLAERNELVPHEANAYVSIIRDLLALLDAERERVRELEAEASNLRAIIAEAIDSKRGYCPGPNGHSQDYVMKSSVQKMRRALAAHRKRALAAGEGGR